MFLMLSAALSAASATLSANLIPESTSWRKKPGGCAGASVGAAGGASVGSAAGGASVGAFVGGATVGFFAIALLYCWQSFLMASNIASNSAGVHGAACDCCNKHRQ